MQDKVDKMACPECGNKVQCKLDCGHAHSFKAFKQALIWLPFMTNEQLAQLSFETWQEAYNRAAVETEREMQELVDNVVGKR